MEIDERRLKLPPLNALRTFEAVARRLSFKLAAEELFVTPAAVSRQVRTLEDYFGLALFKRGNRAIELTGEGQLLLPATSRALRQLANVSSDLMLRRQHNYMTLAISSAFAQLWFMPRLKSLSQLYPDLQLHLLSRESNPDINDDFDAAVMLGELTDTRFVSEYLFSEEVFPVCTPNFLEHHPEVSTLEGLISVTLLDLSKRHWVSHIWTPIDWDFWLAALNVAPGRQRREMQFSQFSMMMDAVRQEMGVGLAWQHLVQAELESGELVRPLDASYVAQDRHHYLVYHRKYANAPEVLAIRDWLLAETEPLRQ